MDLLYSLSRENSNTILRQTAFDRPPPFFILSVAIGLQIQVRLQREICEIPDTN